jgi:hypothetical protein
VSTADRAVRWAWAGAALNLGLIVTVFFPWRTVVVTTVALSPGKPADPLGIVATESALDGVHRVLAAQTASRVALEILVLCCALAGVVYLLAPLWLGAPARRPRTLRVSSLIAVAATAAACWVVPAFQPHSSLTVRLDAVTAPAAYVACSLAVLGATASYAATARRRAPAAG